jgi:hypothetical protein
MKPLQWLKVIYETFGTPYPRASLIVVMILCAIVGGGAWLVLAKQVQKDRINSSTPSSLPPPSVSGPASTSGNNSPANTGNGNVFNYDQSKPPK